MLLLKHTGSQRLVIAGYARRPRYLHAAHDQGHHRVNHSSGRLCVAVQRTGRLCRRFLTMAAHVAAMAPGTNIGAAHPVVMGGGEMDKTMKEKVENDSVAYIKSIAEQRGRNVAWAEDAVRKSVSVTEREALKLNIIDVVADDLPALLKQLDGRQSISQPARRCCTRRARVARISHEPSSGIAEDAQRSEHRLFAHDDRHRRNYCRAI